MPTPQPSAAPSDEGRRQPETVEIQLRVVAIGAGLVALAALIALVVVAATTDADALATVALVLAVLSLSVQLVAYIAQAWTSRQQAVRAEQLNTGTQSVMSRIEEATYRTHQTISEQFEPVLQAALTARETTPPKEKEDPQEYRDRVVANWKETFEAQKHAGRPHTAGTAIHEDGTVTIQPELGPSTIQPSTGPQLGSVRIKPSDEFSLYVKRQPPGEEAGREVEGQEEGQEEGQGPEEEGSQS